MIINSIFLNLSSSASHNTSHFFYQRLSMRKHKTSCRFTWYIPCDRTIHDFICRSKLLCCKWHTSIGNCHPTFFTGNTSYCNRLYSIILIKNSHTRRIELKIHSTKGMLKLQSNWIESPFWISNEFFTCIKIVYCISHIVSI